MRLPVEIPIPDVNAPTFVTALRDRLRAIVAELNNRNVLDSATAPTHTGNPGEFVARTPSSIVVAGTAGSRYTIIGWRYVSGSWVEQRMLTGT